MAMLKPMVRGGWSLQAVVVDKALVNYATGHGQRKGGANSCVCLQCDKVLEIGDEAQLLKDPQGARRALYCSVACQRQRYFDRLVERRKKSTWTAEALEATRFEVAELCRPHPTWRFSLMFKGGSPPLREAVELRLWLNRQDYMGRGWAAVGMDCEKEIFAAKLTGKEIRSMVLLVSEALAVKFTVVSLPSSQPEFVLVYRLD